MRKPLLFATTLLTAAVSAQCDFDPEITPDGSLLLCPEENVTLMAGEFDQYQWFVNGDPIEGATGPTLMVGYADSGVPYSVEVTLDGCTEMSPDVLVDGMVFLPLFAIHGGDEPLATGPMGELTFCEGQEMTLTLGMPYTENIVWTNNGEPISDENSTTLVITESGNYSASASPADCPNHVAQLGVEVAVAFIAPQQPTISEVGEEICAQPVGNSYMWYHNDVLLPDETSACIMVSGAGSYTVFVDYGQGCQVMSEPYIIMGMGDPSTDTPWSIYPNPGNGMFNITMEPSLGSGAFYSVLDVTGREVITGRIPLNGLLQLDMGEQPNGTYMFQIARDDRALAPATRFSVVK